MNADVAAWWVVGKYDFTHVVGLSRPWGGTMPSASNSAVQRRKRRQHQPRPRLTTPLVREDGELRPATWDEAMERAVAGLSAAKAKGPEAVGLFSCSKATNEMNYAAQKFIRAAMGSNNIDSCNRT